MSKISLAPDASGTGIFTIASPNSNTNRTLTLPDDTGTIDRLNRAGNVLQVVSATKTDTFSTATTGSFVDVTGLSVSITPSTATNKILVFYNISGTNNTNQAWFSLFRGATQISVGIAAGSRLQVSGGNFYDGNVSSLAQWGSTFLDSPATTSATTYKLAVRSGSATTFVNRSHSYSDTTDHGTAVSTITVMEIAA